MFFHSSGKEFSARSTSAFFRTSNTNECTVALYFFFISSATCCKRSARRAHISTFAPRSANACAHAAPIPLLAPVTNTILFFNEYIYYPPKVRGKITPHSLGNQGTRV